MASLLDTAVEVTGSSARLVWAEPEVIEAAGIAPWVELPIWLPPEGEAAGLHDGDVSAALARGPDLPPGPRDRRRHLGLAAAGRRPGADAGPSAARP